MVSYNRSDLDFILAQIQIAEQNATTEDAFGAPVAGIPLADLIAHFTLPFGLRTVDGTDNNLIPGQEDFGAADTLFPRLLTPNFQPADPVPPGFGPPGSTSYTQTAGNVFDSEPRTISNLIVDQTITNAAAVQAFVDAGLGIMVGDVLHFLNEDGSTGVAVPAGETLTLENVATDEGLSAPFNSWFTLFGQFFDHGLDLTTKGGNGLVFVPLQPDDPLFDPAPGAPNFMVLTRATNFNGPGADGILGNADDTTHEAQNTTTSWVDQNQTYTSISSHQVFLRAYAVDVNGDLMATGELLGNRIPNGTGEYFGAGSVEVDGLATWAVVKAQARELLGINLTDADVTNVPLLATDEYGRFLRGPNGFPQVVMNNGAGGHILVEGNPAAPLDLANAARTGHAFLDDIAHTAAPIFTAGNGADGIPKTADDLASDSNLTADDHFNQTGIVNGASATAYDNELLDAHKITGDGRGNENIGLTTVHHVFHSEHNRLVQHTKDMVLAELANGDTAFAQEWVVPGANIFDGIQEGEWNGERLFQAAKFGTEMQYQHLVFEEFARKVQPLVNIFSTYHADIDPSIVAEFAHVVYRFGHSMLTETVARIDENGVSDDIGLIEAFLNPIAFDNSGDTDADSAGAVIRGMTRQVGNEIDEFVTEALRNNLLGLPLDLATINMTRARSEGVPTLNVARREFFAGTGDSQLRPYTSWVDFAEHVKNPLSVVNFIAAYGTHATILAADTLDEKRVAAANLVFGDSSLSGPAALAFDADRFDFLNANGFYAGGTLGGLDLVDFWIGGLAEAQMPFGGLLGSTFNFVFETQMEKLQDGDRLYYLGRLAGTHFLTELEGNSFANLVSINSNIAGDGMHLPGDIFSVPNYILEVDQSKQITGLGADGRSDPTDSDNPFLVLVNRNDPQTGGPDSNYLKYTGPDHVVLGGTDFDDTLISSIGDDTVWGDGGNDRIEGGAGVDQLIGGSGDDIITDINGDDNIKGQEGNDVINSGDGFDLILAGDGHDFTLGGEDANETFGGEGNDFIYAGDDSDIVFGDGGDDWIEGGNGADLLQGDFGAPFQDSKIIGNDVIFGGGGDDDYDSESGDDIMVAGPGIERNEGMLGFDWVTHKGDPLAADVDLDFTGLLPPDIDAIRHRFDLVEGLSGWDFNDVLRGDSMTSVDLLALDNVALQNNALNTQAQIDLISGLQGLLGTGVSSFSGGNIILGGGGSDLIEGRGGDDIIDGDAKLNVRIGITDGLGNEIGTAEGMFGAVSSTNPLWDGIALNTLMVAGAINPGQLTIVREIIDTTGDDNDIDIALFSDARANYVISAPDGDGFTTVTHNAVVGGGAAVADGVDRVRNVELLRFTDQTIILDNSIVNQQANDTLTINIGKNPANTGAGPEVGDVLTVSGTVTDADNSPVNVPLSAIVFTWQVEQTAGAGDFITLIDPVTETPVTGLTFSPTVGLEIDGLALRVVGTFLDANNFPEFVASDATPPASVPPLPTIAGTIGTPGDDILVGTLGDDLFFGNGGNDLIFGLGGNDTAQFTGISANFIFSFTPEGVLEVNDTIAGTETAVFSIENFRFVNGLDLEDLTLAQVLATLPTPSTNGDDLIVGTAGDDDIAGQGGNDTIFGLDGADVIQWNAGDGHDVVNAGADGAPADGVGDDRFRIRGNGESETFDVYAPGSVPAALTGLLGVPADPNNLALRTTAEIVVTRTVGATTEIVAELSGVDDIRFNGGGGTDVFNLVGDFTGTDLNPNTIEIIGTGDDETVNLLGGFSGTRVVFHGGGGNDTMNGMRTNDVFDSAGMPGSFILTQSDLDGLLTLINGGPVDNEGESEFEGPVGVRELSGIGQGVPDDHFIRLTDAHYGPDGAINPLFADVDPRNISNILGAQETNLAKNAAGANIFFMAFGQYFDHGLDFLLKGGNGKIVIDGVDIGHGQPGTPNFADLTRASVTGYDGETPLHTNKTSPLVDQNQAYGSHELVGQFLRAGDGNGGYGSHLFQGAEDPNAPGFYLLPTLRELIQHHVAEGTVFGNGQTLEEYYPGLVVGGVVVASIAADLASNFMGSGQNLLIDANPGVSLLDHFIAGDGRTNENISLTAMHTIWARNHNFHVENLLEAGFVGTTEELFQAAKMLNEAEYQGVVFNEFANALLGGMRGSGHHGFDEHNPNADPRISHEFAAAAYRFGHSLIGDTLKIMDADGNMVDVPLTQAFLNPASYASLGAGNILGGIATQDAEEVDFNVVNAVRNDLVNIRADLFSFNVARSWDVGLGTLNQVRAGLAASDDPYVSEAVGFAGDLSPYDSWEDFRIRNGLSAVVMSQFMAAYPDLVLDPTEIADFVAANPDITLVGGNTVKGIDRVDLWVGGLAEKHVLGGQVGQTFWVVLHEQFDRLQEADRFYYIDRFDDFDLYADEFENQSFADIVERNTGLTGLPEDIFVTASADEDEDTDSDNDDDDQDDDNDDDQDDDNDDDQDDSDDDSDGTDDGEGTGQNTGGSGSSALPFVVYIGTGDDDTSIGGLGHDTLAGEGGEDTLFGLDGNDNLAGGAGADQLIGGVGDDILIGNGDNDTILAGVGNDTVLAGSGDDTVFGDEGDDLIFGNEGRDVIDGGAGNDTIFASIGDGDDVYNGGAGSDTLDLEAITASLIVDLGSNGIGSSASTQSGIDSLSGFEHVKGGSGSDTIIASNSVNVLDGGGGSDTFVFKTAAAANGDTIDGFQPGDMIDLRPLYASLNLGNTDGFDIVANFNAAGQLKLNVVGEDTIIEGNTDNDNSDVDFSIKIAGRTNLTSSDFA